MNTHVEEEELPIEVDLANLPLRDRLGSLRPTQWKHLSLPTPSPRFASRLAMAQGAYFLVTGAWPLLHYRSFEWVTGPKREPWLVKTVGVLVGIVGAALLGVGRSGRKVTPELRFIAAASAAGLGAVELWYAAKGRIAPIYAVDAVAEAGLVTGWLLAERSEA